MRGQGDIPSFEDRKIVPREDGWMMGTAANTSDAECNQHYLPLYYAALK
jgi:hypothetical protein